MICKSGKMQINCYFAICLDRDNHSRNVCEVIQIDQLPTLFCSLLWKVTLFSYIFMTKNSQPFWKTSKEKKKYGKNYTYIKWITIPVPGWILRLSYRKPFPKWFFNEKFNFHSLKMKDKYFNLFQMHRNRTIPNSLF